MQRLYCCCCGVIWVGFEPLAQSRPAPGSVFPNQYLWVSRLCILVRCHIQLWHLGPTLKLSMLLAQKHFNQLCSRCPWMSISWTWRAAHDPEVMGSNPFQVKLGEHNPLLSSFCLSQTCTKISVPVHFSPLLVIENRFSRNYVTKTTF